MSPPRNRLLARAVAMVVEMRADAREPARWRVSTDLMNDLELLTAALGPFGFNVTRRSLLTHPVVVDADLPPNSLILEAHQPAAPTGRR